MILFMKAKRDELNKLIQLGGRIYAIAETDATLTIPFT